MIIWSRPKEMSYLCWLRLIVVTENETCVIMKKNNNLVLQDSVVNFHTFPILLQKPSIELEALSDNFFFPFPIW